MTKTNSSGHEAPGPAHSVSPAQPKPLDIVRSAPVLDIMVEQIEYLAYHSAAPCPSGCPDCARLDQVSRYLLAPFR